MSTERIPINDEMLETIIVARRQSQYKAQHLSEICTHSQSRYWLSNIENKKTTSMSKERAIILFSKLFNCSEDKAWEKIEDLLLFSSKSNNSLKSRTSHYSYNNQFAEFNRRLNIAHANLKEMIKQGFESGDQDTFRQKLSAVNTLIELLSTPSGRTIFEALFSIPLHKLSAVDAKKVISYARNRSDYEYEVKRGDINGNSIPELSIKCLIDMFS